MKLAVVALTNQGTNLASRLRDRLKKVDLYLPQKFSSRVEGSYQFNCRLKKLIGRLFKDYDGIIFIMALGIVVRVIAPYLVDKRDDPAVITIDETGQNVISTLSGHLGGANKLTTEISSVLDANPVITTATDCQGKLAIDLLAQRLNCEIMPFENLKLANAAVVNNRKVNIFTNLELDLKLADNINLFPLNQLGNQEGFPVIISNRQFKLDKPYLHLIPKNLVLGIGSRQGVTVQQVEKAVDKALKELNLCRESIKLVATVDLKEEEVGILEFAKKLDVNLNIISRAEIKACEFDYTKSGFVKKMIGVGGVCEPVAMISAQNPQLLVPKRSKKGVTVAVVEESYI